MKTLTDIRGIKEYNILKPDLIENVQITPPVLVLKLKEIKESINNTKVAIYYSDKLRKYVTIPFTVESLNEQEKIDGPQEMDNLSMIQHIVATNSDEEELEFNDGTRMPCNSDLANCILACYARLSKENKAKFEEAINCGSKSFIRVAKFCQKNQV